MDEKKKTEAKETVEKDTFWVKVLVITIIVIWTSLVAGSWVGHYVADTKILSKRTSMSLESGAAEKPAQWKKVVDVDDNGEETPVEQGGSQDVPDFRNIDNPIPGIDDQAIRTLSVQKEPVPGDSKTESPPALPGSEEKKSKEQGTEGHDASTPAEDVEKQPDGTKTPDSPGDKAIDSNNVRKSDNPTDSKTPDKEETLKKESTSKESAKTEKPKEPAKIEKPKEQITDEKPGQSADTHETFDLQVGSFSREENAATRLQELQKKGYSAKIEKINDGEKEYYKVRITGMGDREKASTNAEKLKTEGYDAIIISR